MATFPGGVHDFGSPHVDDVDEIIHAYEINDLNSEVIAMETWLRANLVTDRAMNNLNIASPAVAYSAHGDASASVPGWFVDGAGVCHWYGLVDPNGVGDIEFLTGAPAPADGCYHQFPAVAYQDGAANIGVDTYSLASSGGWVIPGVGSGISNAFFTRGSDGYIRLGGVLVAESTYGYGSYIASLPGPCDFGQHYFWVKDMGLGNDVQIMLDQYGNLLTGPQCNNGSGYEAHAGHQYSFEGIAWKVSGPLNIVVQPSGNGRIDGLLPLGQTYTGDAGAPAFARISLEGVRYYVGL